MNMIFAECHVLLTICNLYTVFFFWKLSLNLLTWSSENLDLLFPVTLLSFVFFHLISFMPSPSFVLYLPVSVCTITSPFVSSFLLCFFSVRRMLWPAWPLTPRLSVCLCRRGQEREPERRRKAQGRPNQNACMSPTSLSVSETPTSARCLGYEIKIKSSLSMGRL